MITGCIGFLGGAIFSAIFFMAGVLTNAKNDDRDSDIRIYIPVRDRDRGSYKRDNEFSPEEVKGVLYAMRMGASAYERDVLDYVIRQEDEKC